MQLAPEFIGLERFFGRMYISAKINLFNPIEQDR